MSKTKVRPHLRDEIEDVRSRNPIAQVIGRYVDLMPRGRLLVARCPFHDDRNPSLVVYAHSQTWHCFGCDLGGDVFSFIERIERVSFAQALARLDSGTIRPLRADAAPIVEPFPPPQIQLTAEHFALLTAASEVYHAAIFQEPDVLDYLARRAIDLDTIRRFHIGYSTGGELANYLRYRGWNPDIAEDLGLLGQRSKAQREFFTERIVIPEIRVHQVVYLVGRATQSYQHAKYLTLPGVPKPLYGLEMIKGAHEVFLVEGPFDWITLSTWGYATLALMGAHIKDELISELASALQIYIVTHPDKAGERVARQLVKVLGKRAHVLSPIPNAKDPNELASQPHAKEIFASLLQKTYSMSTSRRSD